VPLCTPASPRHGRRVRITAWRLQAGTRCCSGGRGRLWRRSMQKRSRLSEVGWKPVAGGSGAPLLLCKRSERSSSSAPNRAARHSAHFGFSRKATRLGPFTEGRPVSCRPKTALWAEPGRNALQNKDPTRKPIHDARPYLIRICAWLMNWWHT
jgi:hypothetical protein